MWSLWGEFSTPWTRLCEKRWGILPLHLVFDVSVFFPGRDRSSNLGAVQSDGKLDGKKGQQWRLLRLTQIDANCHLYQEIPLTGKTKLKLSKISCWTCWCSPSSSSLGNRISQFCKRFNRFSKAKAKYKILLKVNSILASGESIDQVALNWLIRDHLVPSILTAVGQWWWLQCRRRWR